MGPGAERFREASPARRMTSWRRAARILLWLVVASLAVGGVYGAARGGPPAADSANLSR